MTKKNAVLYPFDVESAPIIRFSEKVNYNITYIVSPRGWGLSNKDVSFVDCGEETGKVITYDFQEALNNCEAVFFVEPNMKIDKKKMIIPKILKSIEEKKEIICLIKLDEIDITNITKKCKDKKVKFCYMPSNIGNELTETKQEERDLEIISDINTPIIFVSGLSERTHKFHTQLALRENFIAKGYKVSQIGSRYYCELFGFHSFPKFMFSRNIAETRKIIMFNKFVKEIENNENPDVIIVGIPGGIGKFNNILTNKFGIIFYEIFNAVFPDAVVFNTLYDQYSLEDINNTFYCMKHRFGIGFDCFNLCPVKLNYQQSMDLGKNIYSKVPIDTVQKKIDSIKNQGIKSFNILNTKSTLEMTEYLIDKLSSYGDPNKYMGVI